MAKQNPRGAALIATRPTDSLTYKRDVAGIFPSDAHRRVLAAIWGDELQSAEEIFFALDGDDFTPLGSGDQEATNKVLQDLAADGFITYSENGYLRTQKGFEELQKDPPDE